MPDSISDLISHIGIPYLFESVAFLLLVVAVVPLCKYLRLSPILAFLCAGAIFGPYGLSVVSNAEKVQHLAEVGVLLLLFMIGLELSFARLKAFAKLIFGFGMAHVVICASSIAVVAYLWGNDLKASVIIGACLALSSTAMVTQILKDQGDFASPHGRASFSVLLFQDLAVVPILIFLPLMGSSSETSVLNTVVTVVLQTVITIAFIIFLGRFVFRHLFHLAAKTHSVEVFTAMTMLSVLITSILTGFAGLSMALGAFLAGLLLSETKYRYRIEIEIEPFKGLFLSLFFFGVGMNLDFILAFEQGGWVFLTVVGLIVFKTLLGTIAGRLTGVPWLTAGASAIVLAEAGEFAFVVIGHATLKSNLIPRETGQFMVVVACLSMMFTPLLATLAKKLQQHFEKTSDVDPQQLSSHEDDHDHVIIAGFGRTGESVAAILEDQKIPYVALDNNLASTEGSTCKNLIHVANAANAEVLEKVGAARASVLLVTMNDWESALEVVVSAREKWPALPIVVRARDRQHYGELIEAGATQVVPEALESSLQLGSHVLDAYGFSSDDSVACIELQRRLEYERMRHSA